MPVTVTKTRLLICDRVKSTRDAVSAGRATTRLPLWHRKWQNCRFSEAEKLRRLLGGSLRGWSITDGNHRFSALWEPLKEPGVILKWITGTFTLHFNSSHLANQRVSEVQVRFATASEGDAFKQRQLVAGLPAPKARRQLGRYNPITSYGGNC